MANTSPEQESEGKKTVVTTVRKAAVVLNPFGPTSWDPADTEGSNRRRTVNARQLRFIITPSAAVHALNPYTITNTVTASNTIENGSGGVQGGQSSSQIMGSTGEEGEEEEEFLADFDGLEEGDLLAIGLLEGSTPGTPLG